MAFVDEWVDKKNKTPTESGDKLNANDLNLLARGIFEALAQGGGSVPQYGALSISGDDKDGYIELVYGENPQDQTLHIRGYNIDIEGTRLTFNTTTEATGLKVSAPTDSAQAANKGYVDDLVGDIDTALFEIIELQNSFKGGDA